VSLVIENGNESGGSGEAVRSVPPAYVDYRIGYSRADKAPRFERPESEHMESSTSGHGHCGGGTRGSDSMTYVGSGSSNPTRAPSVKKEERETRQEEVQREVERETEVPGDEVDARTMTDSNTVRELPNPAPAIPDVPAPEDESDSRDRTTSGDSGGASTIKPTDLNTSDDGEASQPLERANTTDLTILTAANTAANQSPTGPSTPITATVSRPSPEQHSSAPAVVMISEDLPSAEQPAESTWIWGRALGMFGMAAPAATTSAAPSTQPSKD